MAARSQPKAEDGSDEAPVRDKDGTRWRRCAVTAATLPERALIRFVVGPEDVVVPDVAAVLPGRGTWISARREILAQGIKRNAFARSQKRQVKVDGDLLALVETLLAKRCLDALGLARRTGALVTGFETVTRALRAREVRALIEASDGAEDGRRKVFALAGKAQPGLTVAALFGQDDLGKALGTGALIHAGLTGERDTGRFLQEARRLAGLRPGVPQSWLPMPGLEPVGLEPVGLEPGGLEPGGPDTGGEVHSGTGPAAPGEDESSPAR